MVGMQKIDDFLSKKEMDDIAKEVKDAAKEIIHKKGATYYGIGMCLVKITNAIIATNIINTRITNTSCTSPALTA